MYTIKAVVSYEKTNGETAYKVNTCAPINKDLLTDDKQAEKWAKILFAGFKAYYTKKDYNITVTLSKSAEVLALTNKADETDEGDDW